MNRIASLLLMSAVLLLLGGCATGSQPKDPEAEAKPDVADSIGTLGEKPVKAPLAVEIAQAFIDAENQLNVKVHLQTETPLETPDIRVGLLGMKEGEISVKRSVILHEVFPDELLSPGQTAAVSFKIPAEGLDEYQVKCSWGEDALELSKEERVELAASEREEEVQRERAAAPVLVKADGRIGIGKLILSGIQVEQTPLPCDSSPCDFFYTVFAQLENGTAAVVSTAELAVGLTWANEGQEPNIPAEDEPLRTNEERVLLDQLNLLPGERKPVRINIDRQIPVIPGGGFHPHVRIVTSGARTVSSTE